RRKFCEVNRYEFYDHMKAYCASPPEVLQCDEKNLREYSVFNCCGVVIRTNYKSNGLYLPAEDRRHYVAWSECTQGDFEASYWDKLWGWYESGGYSHVAAYLPDSHSRHTGRRRCGANSHRAPQGVGLPGIQRRQDSNLPGNVTQRVAAIAWAFPEPYG